MENTKKRLTEILDEISKLPVGNITRKTIRGKSRMYLQWREDGKSRSRYIKAEEEADTAAAIERRKALEKEYRNLKNGGTIDTESFLTNVKSRDELTAAAEIIDFRIIRSLSADTAGNLSAIDGEGMGISVFVISPYR